MAKAKEYVCGYKHCLHAGEKVKQEEAKQSGSRYYHPDCLQQKNNMNDVKNLYYEHISKTVVMKNLMKVINNDVKFKLTLKENDGFDRIFGGG